MNRRIKLYNWSLFAIVMIYLGLFIWTFFTPLDIEVVYILAMDLALHSVLLLIYAVTVLKLYRTLKHFPSESMGKEISSIKTQFFAFLIGFSFQAIYLSY